MKNLKKWELIFGCVILAFLLTSLSMLYTFTGIFQAQKIDDRDIEYWVYDEKGVIENSEKFLLDGSKEICWLMIHSYGSTPGEMKELSKEINTELGDEVYTPRLLGHGEVPSKLLNLNLEDWYKQIEEDYSKINLRCNKINVVGSSFGAVLALRLAENYELNKVFLVNPYLSAGPVKDVLINILSEKLVYIKKTKVANINNQEGLENHIAYWNFALSPVKNSKPFIEKVDGSLGEIKEDLLLIHSTKDSVSDLRPIINVKDKIGSENFEMILFDDSNHILLADYNKQETIEGIVFSSPGPILIKDYNEKNVIKGIIEFEKLKR